MRFRAVAAVLGGSALIATLAVAQEPAAPPPPVFQVTTLELTPATMAAFRNARAKVAEAAKALNLPVEQFGWWDYNDGNRTMIVSPRNRDNVLQGLGNARARIREANPEADKEITAMMEGTQVRVLSQELIMAQPNRTYEPATQPEVGGVSISDIRIAPGQGQAFNEALAAMNKVRADIKYPYPMRAFNVRFGESRTVLATFFDTREAYYGKNQMGRLLEGNAAAQAEWQAAVQKFVASTASLETRVVNYSARQSYAP